MKRQEILAVYGAAGVGSSHRQNQKRINDEVKRESKFFKQRKPKKDKREKAEREREREKAEREREREKEKDKDKEREKAKERERNTMAAAVGEGGTGGPNQAVGLWELFK